MQLDVARSAVRADRTNWLGAWDPITFDRIERFEPQWTMAASGEGTWELLLDTDNCMWAGSDVIQGATARDHLGGFARFCPGDTTAPSRPAAVYRYGMALAWTASTDNVGGPLRYEILRNDRVIAVTTNRAFVAPSHGHYFIRAVDTAGNVGRSTTVKVV